MLADLKAASAGLVQLPDPTTLIYVNKDQHRALLLPVAPLDRCRWRSLWLRRMANQIQFASLPTSVMTNFRIS